MNRANPVANKTINNASFDILNRKNYFGQNDESRDPKVKLQII